MDKRTVRLERFARSQKALMSTLGIASIQLAGRKDGNIDLIDAEFRSIAKRFPWIDMIVCGELAVHGPSPENAEPAGGSTEQRFRKIARETGKWLIPGSQFEARGDKIFNTSLVIDPQGEIVARYDKMFPFLPYEKGITSGVDPVVFDVPGAGRIGIAICYDMWFPEAMRTLAGMGAEAIILPTMTNTIDRDVEIAIARANAAVNQCYFIDVNVAGEQGNGRSVFYGPGGELLHECGTEREVSAFEIDFEQVRRARERGWHGLGQVLKSFRDAPARFPLHESSEARQRAMSGLGELRMPDRQTASQSDQADENSGK
jgi:predicted amidohydrolase